jgi:hypothetical protein
VCERAGILRTRVRRLGRVLVLGLVVPVAGCGTLVYDQSKNENNIRRALVRLGVDVKSVKCPNNVKLEKGAVAYCTARLQSGETATIRAVQIDLKGDVRYSATAIIATVVQSQIDARLSHLGVRATAACPRHVPIVVGNQFDCTLTDAQGETAQVPVTIVSPTGQFRLGRPRL